MASKRKNWTSALLRTEIRKWKADLQRPINEEEIEFNNLRNSQLKAEHWKYIAPIYKVPTKASFNLFISKNTIKAWRNGSEKLRKLYDIYQDEVVSYVEERLLQRTQNSGKGAAGAMFILKSTFGYSEYGKREEQQPVIVNINTENKGNNKL